MNFIALGNFDGVHTAHKKVLETAGKHKNSLCLMFREHPLKTLTGKCPPRILSAKNAEKKIYETGIKKIEYIDFSAVKDMEPEEFFEKILLKKYSASGLSCGYNYSFGAGGKGDSGMLKSLCLSHGIDISVTEKAEFEGESISSSRIRKAISEGEIEKANKMLGYEFFYDGEIVHGKELGRTLGFPTVNQFFNGDIVKPLSGVYFSRVALNGKTYDGVTNIGSNPTIGESFRSETYIFGFEGDAYGLNAEIALKEFLRGEKKFSSVEELRSAVKKDMEGVRKRCLKK